MTNFDEDPEKMIPGINCDDFQVLNGSAGFLNVQRFRGVESRERLSQKQKQEDHSSAAPGWQ
jgi:hypothetical protein